MADSMSVDQDNAAAPEKAKVPVTVLTGALGAGKTTLVKYILEKPHGYKVAVIQNEFSEEMGIEKPLITDSSGDKFQDIYELPNGCLCCSAKDGLLTTIDQLLERREKFDYVLVEATGIADPESICEIFWVDDGLGSHVYLDGVITLVDGKNALAALGRGAADSDDAMSSLGLETEAVKQVACADILVLNKADLAPEADRARIASLVQSMNPAASLLESTYANVPLSSILGIHAFDKSRLAETIAGLSLPNAGEHGHSEHGHSDSHSHGHSNSHGHGHSSGHGHGHSDGHASGHGHSGHGDYDKDCDQCQDERGEISHGKLLIAAHGVESFLLRGDSIASCYDPDKVRSWMADVLWEGSAGGVFRCKGLFQGPSEEDDDGRSDSELPPLVMHGLQGVGRVFEIDEAPKSTAVAEARFLFIGRGLKCKVLEDGLRRCLWSQETDAMS